MSEAKILVVDDEAGIVNTLRAYLEREGYAVQTAEDGPSALRAARGFAPDLVILDIMLPGMDGLEVLRRLRQDSEVYVLMLTAKTDEMDKIVGLTVGADDYLTKPFSPRELVARVKAILRRGADRYGLRVKAWDRAAPLPWRYPWLPDDKLYRIVTLPLACCHDSGLY